MDIYNLWNILFSLETEIKKIKSPHLCYNSKETSCNYFITFEDESKRDSNFLSIKLFYKNMNYPLNSIDISEIWINKNTSFDTFKLNLDNSIKTNIVQIDNENYCLQLVFQGKDLIKKIKKLINSNKFILDLRLILKSMANVTTIVDTEINFDQIKPKENHSTEKLSNITYKYIEKGDEIDEENFKWWSYFKSKYKNN